MRTIKIVLTIAQVLAITAFIVVGASGCGTTTIIHQTVIVGVTPSSSTGATIPISTVSPIIPSPPPGVWRSVQQDTNTLRHARNSTR